MISWSNLIHYFEHESLNEMVDVTDLRVVDAVLQLAPDCIVHWLEIRAV